MEQLGRTFGGTWEQVALCGLRIGPRGRSVNRGTSRGAAVGLPASLLRLHRHGRANLLVTGGGAEQRLAVAQAFHRCSPIAREAFVFLDGARDEAQLEVLLQSWLLVSARADGAGARIGTLYVDSLGALSSTAQRSLLLVARRLDGRLELAPHDGPARLMAGDRTHLVRASHDGRVSDALLDHLDKIRVELDLTRSRGVA
ncbi:MAG: hypothetical protein U0704_10840 [Candidatus Eisenbacteria bacterium]